MTWSYVKKYWSYVALFFVFVLGYFLFKRQQLDFVGELKKIQDAHDEEIKRILQAREEERRQHEANLKQLQDTLSLVQRQYDDAKKDFDARKKKEVEELIKQFGDNPDELAKKLSNVSGFTIVLPQ
jgi:Tfp pilus assembly protein PilO